MDAEAGKTEKKLPATSKRHRTLAEVAKACGKPAVALRSIQKGLGLHVPADGRYSDAYAAFLEKVVALQALHVDRATIEGLFEKECQIMRLLHVDSLTQSPTWYLDACGQPDTKTSRRTRLFLCGHDLGFRLDGSATQDAFDFEAREKQLFGGREMGEDVRRLLKDYVGLLAEVRATVAAEMPALTNALACPA